MGLRGLVGALLVFLLVSGLQAQSPGQDDPRLVHRPPPKAPTSMTPEGRIPLDVMLSDAQGQPVPGLGPSDFQLTDNGTAAKVLSFRSFDGVLTRPNPPVEVILVIDEVNLPFHQVAFVRSELTRLLRQNGGKLAQPT